MCCPTALCHFTKSDSRHCHDEMYEGVLRDSVIMRRGENQGGLDYSKPLCQLSCAYGLVKNVLSHAEAEDESNPRFDGW